MTRTGLAGRFGALLPAALVAMGLLFAGPATAQQPTTVNPTTSAVKEDDLLRALKPGDTLPGRISIPDGKAAVLIQPEGRDWRDFQRRTLPWIGGIAILGMLAVLAVFYLVRGRIRIESGWSGRTILRFTAFERFVHWITATCFILLALTGLNVSFGRQLLLPLIGHDSFTALSQWGKYIHNFLGAPFALGIVLMFLIWVIHNLPNGRDITWLAQGGGLIGRRHPPAGKFNAGQKLIFWSVVLGGAALSITGVILLFPFAWTDVVGMQTTQVVHAVVAIVMAAIILAHIYIGSLGMEGAFDAMGTGRVDLNWAREHHALWVEDEIRKGARAEPVGGPRAVPAE